MSIRTTVKWVSSGFVSLPGYIQMPKSLAQVVRLYLDVGRVSFRIIAGTSNVLSDFDLSYTAHRVLRHFLFTSD
jgi:hypothetical protein